MKNIKKIICLLVTVLCVVASLSACNKACKAERKFYNRSLSLGYQNFCRVPENCRGLRGFYDLPKLWDCQVYERLRREKKKPMLRRI